MGRGEASHTRKKEHNQRKRAKKKVHGKLVPDFLAETRGAATTLALMILGNRKGNE